MASVQPSESLPDKALFGVGSLTGEPASESARTRQLLFAVIAVALVHLVWSYLVRAPGLSWGEDDAQYVNLARSLTEGHYRERWDVDAPLHRRYPPMYPLLLAITSPLTGWDVDAMLFLSAMFSAIGIVLFFDAARRIFGAEVALASTVLTAANPMMIRFAGSLMSEAAFGLFVSVALWGLSRERDGGRYAFIAGLGVLLCAATRVVGVVLVGGLLLYWLYRRRFAWAGWLMLAALTPAAAWLLLSALAPDPDSHRLYVHDLTIPTSAKEAQIREESGSVFRTLAARVFPRVKLLLTDTLPSILAFPTIRGTIADNIAWIGLMIVAGGVGMWRLARQWTGAAVFLAAYVGFFTVWTFLVQRFMLPMVPLLFLALLVGVSALAGRLTPSRRSIAVWGLTIVLLIGTAADSALEAARLHSCDRDNPFASAGCFNAKEQEYFRIAHWVRDSTPANAIVFTNKEAAFSTHTGRRVINQIDALKRDSTDLVPYLRTKGVTHVVVGTIGPRHARQGKYSARMCEDLVLLHGFAYDAAVLRIRGQDEAGDGGAACRYLAPWLNVKLSPLLTREE